MIRKNNNKNSLLKPTTDFVNRYRWQIIIFIGLVIVASVFFPRGKSLKFTYQKDDIARETVIAPFTFPILKPEEKLQQDIDEALKSEPALFIRSQEIVDTQVQKINSLFSLIDEIRATQNK
jgi:membrane-associated HD superfamily phosphohydrolase